MDPTEAMALTFDMLTISRIDKSDPKRAKAAALEALIAQAVDAALKDGMLTGDASALKKDVCTALQYLAGSLLVQGQVKTESGTLTPYVSLKKAFAASQSSGSQATAEHSRDLSSEDVSGDSGRSKRRTAASESTQAAMGKAAVISEAYTELGIAAQAPLKKGQLAKLPAADVRKLYDYLQLNVVQDTNGNELDFGEAFLEIKHGHTGVPTAQDLKDAIWKFLASDI
ncbi:hypothetical protein WJX72_003274 [[Myrmecia] bisecta]|uniref:Uncharacterized protein n=1 Tax=[Myrmecia] bisecta TaxID=41462 RepID=A0AAW1PCX8_9CHLO